MKHCETCRWWNNKDTCPPNYGWCKLQDWALPELMTELAIIGDPAALQTRNDFGCVLHEEREKLCATNHTAKEMWEALA